MDFHFTDEQRMIREMVKKFTDREVRPLAALIDREKEIPGELIAKGAQNGLFGIAIPEAHGGSGFGEVGYCIMMEELSHGCASFAITVAAHQSIGCMPILLDGTEEQKRTFLVPMAAGEKLGAFALTEPSAGSDAGSIRTRAVEDGGDFVINGSKIWITNGGIADIVILYAVTDPEKGPHGGITAFIVPTDTPGFSVGTIEEKMGIRGSSTAELIFEEMRVPKSQVLGNVGGGFRNAMRTLDYGRLGLGAAALGASKEMLVLSIRHAGEREQFGRPIADQQIIQFYLAEMGAKIFAMESMVYRTAAMADAGENFSRESATVKLLCTEWQGQIVDRAMQIHAGMGYMTHMPIERFYRDARINRIFEGTNEIQHLVIARDLLKKGGY
ncbi:MAG: acyl-CoA dehydrogenase [Deltaproteobacteria bacterium]|nr:acyl-CoA dehydrogenase [Deltaproteobacteria bacterium]